LGWDGHPRRDRHGHPVMVVRAEGKVTTDEQDKYTAG
jgi:hypothetical protein